MTKTIYVCDCCGIEVAKNCLHECYKALRTGRNCDPVPKTCTWEICENCIERIEGAMAREADRIANSAIRESIDSMRGDPPDDMYAGGHGIEVGQ